MKVYMPGQDDTILSNRYFSDEDLQGLYSNRPIGQIPPNILQNQNKPQTWTLMKKDKKCAKCTGCKTYENVYWPNFKS